MMYISNANETPTVAADRIRTGSLLAPSDCSIAQLLGTRRPIDPKKKFRGVSTNGSLQ
jgi:hypothetical protein